MALIFGVNNRHPASVGTSTDSLGTVLYEEQSSGTAGSGVGFGQRLAVRHYENDPAGVYTSGQDIVTKFNGGRMIVVSVSGGDSCASITAGTRDAKWNAMFDRMFALDFGGTDTSGITGSKKPLIAPLCYWHEVDVPSHKIVGTDYIAAWKHIKTLRDARALVAGVDASRVPLMTIYTAYGINSGRLATYWPGNDQVDLFGVDSYSGLGGGKWTEASVNLANSVKAAASHGDKDIWICETSVKAETGHNVGTWWANYATYVASVPKIKAVIAFQGAPGDTVVNFDKTTDAVKHEGMRQFIISTGATSGFSTTSTQLKPSGPTGLAFTSDPSGTFGTLTWAANPSGDNVTTWNVFKAPGKVTSGFTKMNTTGGLPSSPRSYQMTGLTPGSPYTFTVSAINSVGASGFGQMLQTVTSKPGPSNLAPTIVAFSADIDATDSTLVHFTSSATDPEGGALTYTISVSGAAGFTDTLTGPNVDKNYTPGAYLASLAVSDGALTTTQVVAFSVAAGPASTDNYDWELPQPGISLPEITRIYRNTLPDIDFRLWAARAARSPWNALQGFVASTFDPVDASANTKTSYAAGDFRWYPMLLQSDTITGIILQVTDAQTGTGSAFCIHDASGVQMCNVQSGTVVDTALQSVSSAGGTPIALDVPIGGLAAGSIIYLGYWVGTGVTVPFKTYLSVAQSVMGQIGLTQGTWRANLLASQTSYPNVLPFSSASSATPAFLALY